jgi:hypothetical protein
MQGLEGACLCDCFDLCEPGCVRARRSERADVLGPVLVLADVACPSVSQLYEAERRAGRSHEESRATAAHCFTFNLGSDTRAKQLDEDIAPARAKIEREMGANNSHPHKRERQHMAELRDIKVDRVSLVRRPQEAEARAHFQKMESGA